MFWVFFAKSQLGSLKFIVRMCVFVDLPTSELFLPNWSLIRWNPRDFFFPVQRLHGSRQVVTRVQSQQKDEL
jgi:hypothetical protein